MKRDKLLENLVNKFFYNNYLTIDITKPITFSINSSFSLKYKILYKNIFGRHYKITWKINEVEY